MQENVSLPNDVTSFSKKQEKMKTETGSQRRQWHPTSVLSPGKSHGQRSLVGCCLWGRTESDTTEATSLSLFTFMHWRRKCYPLQCSCLEDARDGGAQWAAVSGVTQSQTRLKRLSHSSSSRNRKQVLFTSTFHVDYA